MIVTVQLQKEGKEQRQETKLKRVSGLKASCCCSTSQRASQFLSFSLKHVDEEQQRNNQSVTVDHVHIMKSLSHHTEEIINDDVAAKR